jgi:hypothetical protein
MIMKQILFIIFLMSLLTNAFAQIETNAKFKPISIGKLKLKPKTPQKLDVNPLEIKPIVTPKAQNPTSNNYSTLSQRDSISMVPTPKLGNLGDHYIDKMSNDLDKTLVREGLKEDDRLLVKIDVNFGEIRTKSKNFVIRFRDFGQIDGDLAKATFNDIVIANRLEMKNEYQEFKIFFKEGFNTLELEALNKGLLGGNTGEFQIYDDKGKFIISDYWENWDAGVKGKFIIIKE